MKSSDFDIVNSILEGWLLNWATEERPVYTHCKECGKELSTWEKENHWDTCKSCSDRITYGGSLGYHDARM